MRQTIVGITLIAISIAVLATAGCLAEVELDPGTRAEPIINGEPTPDDMYVNVGAVGTLQGGLCAGTLITQTAVLTAAHCVHPEILGAATGGEPEGGFDYFFSFARDLNNADRSDLLEVESVTWHEAFPDSIDLAAMQEVGPDAWHDIAIVRLVDPVTGRPFQKLPEPDEAAGVLAPDAEVEAIGYGMTIDGDQESAGVLHHGVSRIDEVGDYEISAGDGDEQQACRGDSGGPLLSRTTPQLQLGIASHANAPPLPIPGCDVGLTYTRVDTFIEWIREQVPELGDDPVDPGDPVDAGNPVDPGDPDASPGDPLDPEVDAGPDVPGSDAGGNPEEGDDDAGCGCRASGDNAPVGNLLLIGMMAFALVFRRRRS